MGKLYGNSEASCANLQRRLGRASQTNCPDKTSGQNQIRYDIFRFDLPYFSIRLPAFFRAFFGFRVGNMNHASVIVI